MIIVGLTGGIGHGKTTFAVDLARQAKSHAHYESSSIIIEVANDLRASLDSPRVSDTSGINKWLRALPDILDRRVNCRPSFEQICLSDGELNVKPEYYEKLFEYLRLMERKPHLQKQIIGQDNKQTYRSLLQWLGGYLAKKVSGDIWFKEILHRIELSSPIELVTIGGVRFPDDAEVIKRHDGKIILIVRQSVVYVDVKDLTERERADISIDITVNNDGDLQALSKTAHNLYVDLLAGKAKHEYVASEQA
jgi:hypothetical protein